MREIGENVIEKFHPHWLGYVSYYFSGIIIVVIGAIFLWQLIALGILVFVFGEILRKAETYYILDNSVAKGYMFFSSYRKVVLYKNIQNIEVNQSFLERIFGVGDVGFDTSGSHDMEVEFKYVARPYSIEKTVRQRMLM